MSTIFRDFVFIALFLLPQPRYSPKSIDKNKVVPLGKKWVSYSKKFFLAQNA